MKSMLFPERKLVKMLCFYVDRLLIAFMFHMLRDHQSLYCRILHVQDWRWIWGDSPPDLDRPEGFRANMKFRHVMSDIPCSVQKQT